MGAGRRIAGLTCGRWTKWVVLAFWIVVFALAGPLAGKLNSAQQNDASAWLPQNAESTQVVELAKRFTPSDIFPALVVYERADGPMTPADQAKVAADVQRFAGADPSFPLWTFVFLVALGTDYNIFLMTRVHEESRRHGTRRGR